MKRHIATALIAGIGLAAPATPTSASSHAIESPLPASRHDKNTLCRLWQFGHLKSAGRFRRNEIARIFLDEGIVFAEWSGQVHAPQPRRIETEELDAEWMAHHQGPQWLLSRRELIPRGEKLWSVQIYGNEANAAHLCIVATAIDVNRNAAEAFTMKYEQSVQSAKLSLSGNHSGRAIRQWSAAAATLANLRQNFPMVIATYLDPALERMAC